MAQYTKISLNEANSILELYDLPKCIQLEPVGHGISNTNYIAILEDQSEIILKIANDKQFDQLMGEQKILLQLKEIGFKHSPYPLKTKTGDLVYRLHSWHGTISPRFPGSVIAFPTTQSCFEQGKILAALHQASLSKSTTINKKNIPIRSARTVGFDLEDINHFQETSAHCPKDFKEAFFKLLNLEKKQIYLNAKNTLASGIIHGDFYFDNALFDRNNDISIMLDFEQAGLGNFLFDLGISLSGSCHKNQNLNLDLIKSFLNGYQHIRPLSETEKSLMGFSINLGLLSIALWRIFRFNIAKITPNKLDSYQELITRALNFQKDFSDEQLQIALW